MRRSGLMVLAAAVAGAAAAFPVAVMASHGFTDVPDNHTFHEDIQWLRDADVTRGCNPPANTRFCPDDFVTRGQMAAFMNRLAGNQVVDAAALEGHTVADLAPRATSNYIESAPDGEDFSLPAQIDAPAPGVLILSGEIEASNNQATDDYHCRFIVNGELVPGTQMYSRLGGLDASPYENCVTTGALIVGEGTHAIELQALGVAETTNFADVSMWALWVPFDGTGARPVPITD